MKTTKGKRKRFEPVPYELYLTKTLGQLKNKRLIVNLALKNLDKEHPNYQRALKYYSNERDKIQKAINQKIREAGIEPPPVFVSMKTVDLTPKVGMREQELTPEAQRVLAMVHQMVEQLKEEGAKDNG